jgi:hypothetical protein
VRFFSLQRLRVVLRCRGRPGLATIPLRPFSFMQHRQESASGRRLGPCGFSLRVNRARHAPLKPRFTPAGTGHSPRSLFSRGVPLPVLASPARLGRTYFAFGPAALLGFLHPSQYSPPAGPGVCFRRSSPHAVCRSFNTAAFYGCRPSCLNSFQASRARYGQPSNDRIRLLGFVPQASQTDRIERCAGQSCRGFQRSSLRFSDVKENQGTIPTARIRNARLTTAGQRYSVALHHAV